VVAHEEPDLKHSSAMIGHASIRLSCDADGRLMPDAVDGFGAHLDAKKETPPLRVFLPLLLGQDSNLRPSG
jgi:hypothetical protein